MSPRLKHGDYNSPEYIAWKNMLARCRNPKHKAYKNYGGRGITVCQRWLTYSNFLADMGRRPVGATLERRRNSRGYTPANCVWATWEANNSNRRSGRWLMTPDGRMTLTQASKHYKIPIQVIHWRLKHGWSIREACTTGVRPMRT